MNEAPSLGWIFRQTMKQKHTFVVLRSFWGTVFTVLFVGKGRVMFFFLTFSARTDEDGQREVP